MNNVHSTKHPDERASVNMDDQLDIRWRLPNRICLLTELQTSFVLFASATIHPPTNYDHRGALNFTVYSFGSKLPCD